MFSSYIKPLIIKSKLERDTDANSENIEKGELNGLARLLESNIGYIRLPQMYHYDDVEGLEGLSN